MKLHIHYNALKKFHTLVTYKTWLPMTADSYQNSNPYQKCRDSLLLRTVKRLCSWLVEQYLNKWLTSRAVDSLGQLSMRSLHSEFEKKRTPWNFTFLSQPGPIDRDLKQPTFIKALTLHQLLPVFLGFHLQAPDQVGCLSRSHLGHQKL